MTAPVIPAERKADARLTNPALTRDAFRSLVARVAVDCRATPGLAAACDLRLRVWEAGMRGEDWRLVVVQRQSGRSYQVRRWDDWERTKRLLNVFPAAVTPGQL